MPEWLSACLARDAYAGAFAQVVGTRLDVVRPLERVARSRGAQPECYTDLMKIPTAPQYVLLMASSRDQMRLRWIGVRSRKADLDKLVVDAAERHAQGTPAPQLVNEEALFVILRGDTLESHNGQVIRFDARSAAYLRPKQNRRTAKKRT